jgi:hypothetical protein
MPVYNHFYDLPVYKTCREFRKNISLLAKNYFPKNRGISFKISDTCFIKVNNSNHCRGFRKISSSGEYTVLQASKRSLTETMEHVITA